MLSVALSIIAFSHHTMDVTGTVADEDDVGKELDERSEDQIGNTMQTHEDHRKVRGCCLLSLFLSFGSGWRCCLLCCIVKIRYKNETILSPISNTTTTSLYLHFHTLILKYSSMSIQQRHQQLSQP